MVQVLQLVEKPSKAKKFSYTILLKSAYNYRLFIIYD